MAAVNSQLWSRISPCPRTSCTLYRHQNITAITKILHRQHVSRVVQSATFMMKQEGKRRKTRDNNLKSQLLKQRIAKGIGGSMRMKTEGADWPSVFSGAQSFNPFSIPILFKMGRVKHNRINVGLRVRALGNLDLVKIPNFFHLTPIAVERHCAALKSLCTEWPHNIDLSTVPLRITTKNYLFAGPSLYHPKSRIVKLQVYLKDLVLDDHARKKLIELVEDRFDPETDELTIVADRCPTRKQNRDYAMYLLTVLYHESWKTEPWETEVSNEEEDSDTEEDKIPEKRPKRRKQLKLVDGVLYRVNQYGKYFKYFINVKD